ncbi:MAG: SEC-C metal-binding domain-containing protein, partial [Lachnospiraceae bacterium]|nr:SEC-C metal-binding domain-containing protein [Lachnospiraceae bacterium]
AEVFRIKKADFSQIYLLDVTIDNFDELASRMEKIHVADTHEDIIVISLDDLWVYKEYFESPLQFIHYLKQRTIATRTKEISTIDELDHLGMYIEHNMYSIQAQIAGKGYTNVFIGGYREDLDQYFSLKHAGKVVEKPTQHIPEEIKRILELCYEKEDAYTTHFSNFILDMSSDTRQAFCDNIHKISRRESELNSMIPAMAFGEVSFCLYVNKPNVKKISRDEQREYVLATLAKNGNPFCYLIEIFVDQQDFIKEVNYEYLTQSSIPAVDRDRLSDLGAYYSKRRTASFLIQNHKKKIGRNDPCPCGSGRKYKQCCGR